jgi:hypothetical protein
LERGALLPLCVGRIIGITKAADKAPHSTKFAAPYVERQFHSGDESPHSK